MSHAVSIFGVSIYPFVSFDVLPYKLFSQQSTEYRNSIMERIVHLMRVVTVNMECSFIFNTVGLYFFIMIFIEVLHISPILSLERCQFPAELQRGVYRFVSC